jgi:hypothetical protein
MLTRSRRTGLSSCPPPFKTIDAAGQPQRRRNRATRAGIEWGFIAKSSMRETDPTDIDICSIPLAV